MRRWGRNQTIALAEILVRVFLLQICDGLPCRNVLAWRLTKNLHLIPLFILASKKKCRVHFELVDDQDFYYIFLFNAHVKHFFSFPRFLKSFI